MAPTESPARAPWEQQLPNNTVNKNFSYMAVTTMFELMPFGRNDLYRPFRDLENLERSFFSGKELGGFKTDIKDTGDAYVLEADLPGFRKEDIDLHLQDGVLTITAKHDQSAERKDDAGKYVCRERRVGSYARSFDVSGIREEGISASYENGVLTLELPKAVPTRPVSRQIELK